ncbi:MAG: aromatic acid exporter family protein [Terriglobales bacterium]
MSHRIFQQAIATGIAGVVSLYAASFLRLPQGYWAAISSFIVLQSNVAATLGAARGRLIGTAIGAVIGAMFVRYVGTNPLWLGLAVTLTVLLCHGLGLEDSYRLACVTVTIIMLISSTHSAWVTAGYRFLEVSLGIVVAVVIAAILEHKGKLGGRPRVV